MFLATSDRLDLRIITANYYLFVFLPPNQLNRFSWRTSHQHYVDWIWLSVVQLRHGRRVCLLILMRRCQCWRNCHWKNVHGLKHMISLYSQNCHNWNVSFCVVACHCAAVYHTGALHAVLVFPNWRYNSYWFAYFARFISHLIEFPIFIILGQLTAISIWMFVIHQYVTATYNASI